MVVLLYYRCPIFLYLYKICCTCEGRFLDGLYHSNTDVPPNNYPCYFSYTFLQNVLFNMALKITSVFILHNTGVKYRVFVEIFMAPLNMSSERSCLVYEVSDIDFQEAINKSFSMNWAFMYMEKSCETKVMWTRFIFVGKISELLRYA